MLDDSFIEMERAAKALDLQDVNTAAVCLRKALEGHTEMAPPGPTPPANAVGPMAELSKAINALEIKDFPLAGLCAEKAAASLEERLPENVAAALTGAARAIRQKDLTTAASQIRAMIRHYRPDITLPPPAEAPNVTPLEGQIAPTLDDPAVLEESLVAPRF